MTRRHARLLVLASLAALGCGDSGTSNGTDSVEQVDTGTPADAIFGDSVDDVVGFDTGPGNGGDTGSTGFPDAGEEVVAGGFGAACQGNGDCLDGYCVEGPEGFVCTKGCETECPAGYDCRGIQSGSADTVFLCLPRVARLCVPCKADYQCTGGACLELGGVPECATTCDTDDNCPGGYVCGTDPAATHPGKFCQPKSGSCDCTPDFEGAVRTCTTVNAFGTCYGVETCDPAIGWNGCTAATAIAEICDGRDNDCNQLVDDGVETNTPCENTVAGVGTCHGVKVCVGTQGYLCTAQTPEVETCDFRDNDCDGEIDEDFKDANGEFTLPENCGSCGNDCADKIANGTGKCEVVEGASPVCVVAACDPDYVELNRFQCALPPDVSCLPCQSDAECYDGSCTELDGQKVCVVPCGDNGSCQDGYACTPVDGADRCVPVSASCLCNPLTDGQVRTCIRSSASGTCYGQETCDAAAGWTGCTAHVPADEVCNGVDDDCSSGVDDVLGRGDACPITNSFGTCMGTRDCVAGSEALTCVGATPAAEICNYADDDCDGQTDEGFSGLYTSCSSGVGACQRFGFVACKADGSDTECNAVAGASSPEKCDRLDNNCDGKTDEPFTDLGTVCSDGVGACRGFGTMTCKADGSGTECNAVAGTGSNETCDLIDNDCDGLTDNGFKNAAGKYNSVRACGNCYTDCSVIYAKLNAHGSCDDSGADPACVMVCEAGFFNLNAVPDDGCELKLDTTAIYVGADSLGALDDATCGLGPLGTGAGNHPCASISYGLGRATGAGRVKLIVADALYSEQLVLTNGISVLGGYRSDTWERHLSSTGTIVRGTEGSGDRKAIVATGITSATLVEGLVVNAANAVSSGANSYGIYIRNSTGALQIKNNLIFAGLGAPGVDGGAGISGQNGVGGTIGLQTKNVANPCSGPNNPGGAGGVKQCLDPGTISSFTSVNGGKGGDSVCPDRNIQEGAGVTGQNSGGTGGAGGWGHQSYEDDGCNPSSAGPETGVTGGDAAVLPGRDGNGGGACTDDDGVIVGDEWRGVAGLDGGHGGHGGGGGGGGAGSGSNVLDGNYDISGSGGGGGSGGCAGSRGNGGQAGGGSFGIFVYWSGGNSPASAAGVPSITSNVVARNQGGPGGNGGNGGAGGDPGAGALGGPLNVNAIQSSPFCVFGGAKGGFGARGGHGGGGGGACGGASFDIFAWGINGQANDFGSNMFPNGGAVTGGTAGGGGNSSNTTHGGATGLGGASGTIHIVN